MMTLSDITLDFPAKLQARVIGDPSVEITALTHDSRDVVAGTVFVCLKGEKSDGHRFIPQALAAGAAAIVVSDLPDQPLPVPVVVVTSTRKALPYLAAGFYSRPSSRFGLTGVTGTNGKTTVTYMISSIFAAAGKKTGVIGTTGVKIGGVDVETHWSVSTTPESPELQKLFATMDQAEVDEAVIEVSSHAIDQERTACCEFNTAVFTNLTQDHLDYHKTMGAYSAAKQRLFSEYGRVFAKKPYHVVLNVDDATGRDFTDIGVSEGFDVWTYSVDAPAARIRATQLKVSPSGTDFTVTERGGETYDVRVNIGGLFNVYNALAAIGATRSRGVSVAAVQQGLATLPNVPGRFELVDASAHGFHVLVDYAHTPDGIENVLTSARALKPARLICVFGCGGDRDRTKRPIMGRLATELADRVVITSDNPRTEDPATIIADIVAGIDPALREAKVAIEPDRRAAIRLAIREARQGDLVVIAGKGHETYQLVAGQVLEFDDRKVAREEIDACE
ncbi:MAG TPA: UDP-N-acetylmuramoyl-L-alanyl-D-glutamate--2,6-diaminopimelate ligase [Capsulimonadaceae bacterium]|jgi:UDP-N-acetylmuramoyl-L-alanyl-D-glutamate--2,6-diaminopimelate ligase